jgi:hypothetical protein
LVFSTKPSEKSEVSRSYDDEDEADMEDTAGADEDIEKKETIKGLEDEKDVKREKSSAHGNCAIVCPNSQ